MAKHVTRESIPVHRMDVAEQTIAEAYYIARTPNLMIIDIPLEQSDDEAFAVAFTKWSTELQEELNKNHQKQVMREKIDEFIKKNHELAEQTATE